MSHFDYKPASDLNLAPTERLRSVQREPGLISTTGRWFACAALDVYLGLYHRLRIEGREHIPRSLPFVLVGNHTSHLDAMVLAACLPRLSDVRSHVFPLAAGDVFFTTPATAALSSVFIGALPMWRKSIGPHMLEQLRKRLIGDPCGYILFPEGARSRDGSLMRFKPGIGMMVAGTAVPVVPCAIGGAFEAMPPDKRVPRPRRLTVRIGPARTFADAPNDRSGWDRVASELEAAVRELAGGVGR